MVSYELSYSWESVGTFGARVFMFVMSIFPIATRISPFFSVQFLLVVRAFLEPLGFFQRRHLEFIYSWILYNDVSNGLRMHAASSVSVMNISRHFSFSTVHVSPLLLPQLCDAPSTQAYSLYDDVPEHVRLLVDNVNNSMSILLSYHSEPFHGGIEF